MAPSARAPVHSGVTMLKHGALVPQLRLHTVYPILACATAARRQIAAADPLLHPLVGSRTRKTRCDGAAARRPRQLLLGLLLASPWRTIDQSRDALG